jgi:hypothetical protein
VAVKNKIIKTLFFGETDLPAHYLGFVLAMLAVVVFYGFLVITFISKGL